MQQFWCSRLSTARQVAQTLHRQLRRQTEDKEAQQKERYQKLIRTSEHLVTLVHQVFAVLRQQTGLRARRKRCRRSWNG